MTNKPGMPWQHLCGFDQLNSRGGSYTWAREPKKNLWAIMWKDRNVVSLISNRYDVSPEFIERGGGGKYKTSKPKATNVPYGRYRFNPRNTRPFASLRNENRSLVSETRDTEKWALRVPFLKNCFDLPNRNQGTSGGLGGLSTSQKT